MPTTDAFVWPNPNVKAKRGRPQEIAETPGTPDPEDSGQNERIDPIQVLKIVDAAALLKVSTRTLKRWERSDPEFPKPFPIGLRKRNWLYADLTAYILRKAGKTVP